MKFPSFTLNQARVIAGGGSFLLTLVILAMMFFKPELAKDDLFKSLAQALIIQGLIGLVMAFLFTGKQVNEDGPQKVEVMNPPDRYNVDTPETSNDDASRYP